MGKYCFLKLFSVGEFCISEKLDRELMNQQKVWWVQAFQFS